VKGGPGLGGGGDSGGGGLLTSSNRPEGGEANFLSIVRRDEQGDLIRLTHRYVDTTGPQPGTQQGFVLWRELHSPHAAAPLPSRARALSFVGRSNIPNASHPSAPPAVAGLRI
jgi:hypothetical protein